MAATTMMNGAVAARATATAKANTRSGRRAVLARASRPAVRPRAAGRRTQRASRPERGVQMRASASEDLTAKAEEYLEKAKTAWAENDSKPTTLLIAGAAVTTLVVADGVLAAVEKLPLIPSLFELIGIGFTAWFVYRYLLFKPDRAELKAVIDDLITKVQS